MANKLTVMLETVTPLFLGGSEPRGDPELRPASFKGELRFWWRALWGGVNPDKSPAEMAQEESKIFGDTEAASPIILRLFDEPTKKEIWQFGKMPGVDYLFFSVKGNRNDPDRKGFSAKQSFQLSLQPRLGQKDEQKMKAAFDQACAALWLFIRFGGIGARSRRGAGNLRGQGEPEGWPEDFPSLVIRSTSVDAFVKETRAGLAQLYRVLNWSPPISDPKIRPEFDILHPQGAPLYVLNKEWNSWQEALNAVGTTYRDFRSRRQPDYDNVKDVVAGNTTRMQPIERAAFGLPIVFYYRSLSGQRGTLEGKDADRRASPLIFHVSQLANGKYVVSFVRFNARLLPSGDDLKLKPRGRPAFAKPPNSNLITDFLLAIGEPGHKDKHGDLFIAPMLEVTYPSRKEQADE